MKAAHARLLVLVAWAATFLLLWATASSSRYLGARTQWLVPLGAVALGGAAIMNAASRRGGARLRTGEAVGLLGLLVPLVAVLLVPHAQLGAYAASHKSSAFFPAVKPRPPATPRDVTLLDVKIAERDPEFALISHIHPGTRVELVGVVTRVRHRGFELTRFFITCCIADAQPLSIHVDARRALRLDQWVRVDGTLTSRGSRLALDADTVTPVTRPSNPYLSFSSG
jgi:uncharacterized repeat protein (TIGR03943 family)